MSEQTTRRSRRPPKPTPADWLRLSIPVLLVAGFIVLAWKLGYFNLEQRSALDRAAQTAQHRPWFAGVFIVAYAAIATLAAPVSPMAYAAGAMFGVGRGAVYVWIGSMLGGAAGYWLARGVWAESARRLLGRYHEKLQHLQRSNAFLTTLRLQALPIVPFGVFNYAAGSMGIAFAGFLGGTALGLVPGTIAAVYVGDRVAAGFSGGGKRAFIIAAAVMLALVALSFLPAAIRKLRNR